MENFLEELEQELKQLGENDNVPYHVGDDDTDIETYLSNKIREAFPEANVVVDSLEAFSSPGYDVKIVTIAYVIEGVLNTYMLQVERC